MDTVVTPGKTCNRCKTVKSFSEFGNNRRLSDGLQSTCKSCLNEASKLRRKTAAGRANYAWHDMYWRSQNRSGNDPSYASVELRMTKKEFLEWAIPQFKQWEKDNPGVRSSVDRIESSGHYELGNIRIISLSENAGRRLYNKHKNSPPGMQWCSGCKAYLPVSRFSKLRCSATGLSYKCKTCNSRECLEYYHSRKRAQT